jgi:glycosidase
MTRFDTGGTSTLIQCAEQLEDPVGILWQSYSNSTWQNGTMDAARAVAHGEPGAIDRFGNALGLSGYPVQVPINGELLDRTALQYLETHDQSRFLAEFGVVQPDEAGNQLFLEADRGNWFKVQPYLIGLLTAKGIPMLFEGEELGEAYTLPGNGLGRVSLLRPVNWDHFYDQPGRTLVNLVRTLLRLRRERDELRRGSHWFYDDPARLQNRGVLAFSRNTGGATTVIAVNFTGQGVTVPFTMPSPGTWTERLGGTDLTTAPDGSVRLDLSGNYGRVLTYG